MKEPKPKPDPPTYLLTIRPLPDPTDMEGVRRLRLALKVLLRRFGLKCVGVKPRQRPQQAVNHVPNNPQQGSFGPRPY